MAQDPWHYARNDIAARTFAVLADGPARALTLFAPRRTGKAEFLLDDLGPFAENKGHRVVYASFWQAPLSPLAVLLHTLETSRKSGTLRDRVRSAAVNLTPKLRLSAPIPGTGAKAEIDLTGLKGKPPADLPHSSHPARNGYMRTAHRRCSSWPRPPRVLSGNTISRRA